jgi:aspartyl-tRNA(Asn)/glutamyl-tRNA(Gln) amidotransferase subunit A
MTPDEALSSTVSEIAPEIKSGRLSPVALTEASLAKLDGAGRKLNAVANLTRERALAQAHAAEGEIAAGSYRGPLHGVPYGAKDLLAARGTPTTWGAKPLVNQTFDADATVIRRLQDAGAILVAKLAMIELAGGLGYNTASASATGPAKNPWKTDCWTCGSSSGSGAATAAGLVGFAIGSETWGSIVCPSAFCGVTGLRPTYGLVPRTGAMALSWTMDKIGPMARSAEDCELVLAAIAGHDPADPASLPPRTEQPKAPDQRGMRLGIVRLDPKKGGDTEVFEAFETAVKLFADQGLRLRDASLPDLPFEPAAITFITAEAVAAFEPLIFSGRNRELVDPAAHIAAETAKTVTGSDFVRAMQARRIMQAEMDKLFDSFDALVSPSVPYLATRLDADLEKALPAADPLGAAGNLCGLPALSVPCGFSKSGLPIGLQIVGRALDEAKVLALGRLYQQNTDWHRRRPAIP